MTIDPWLTIVGIGEDGAEGLSAAVQQALARADVVIGAKRHLNLLGNLAADTIIWPIPFADGMEKLLALRGRNVVMLTSGNPFWFGAGSVVAKQLERHEWRALPAPSVFSLAAAELGWPIDTTICMGLHAAPFARLRRHLATGAKAIVLLRDGKAVQEFAHWLTAEGFGATKLHALEALGGPRARVRRSTAEQFDLTEISHPVAVAADIVGRQNAALPSTSGRPDTFFEHDGQITKRPVRALTLSALAPVAGETLWDIGAGSGSISIEWLLSHPSCEAIAIEADPLRADRIRTNAARLGVDRLQVVEGAAADVIAKLATPDAVFIGGGLTEALLDALWTLLPPGCRVVANAVTIESETLITTWRGHAGGSLLRIQLSDIAPIGSKHGWRSSYPIVQWSVTR